MLGNIGQKLGSLAIGASLLTGGDAVAKEPAPKAPAKVEEHSTFDTSKLRPAELPRQLHSLPSPKSIVDELKKRQKDGHPSSVAPYQKPASNDGLVEHKLPSSGWRPTHQLQGKLKFEKPRRAELEPLELRPISPEEDRNNLLDQFRELLAENVKIELELCGGDKKAERAVIKNAEKLLEEVSHASTDQLQHDFIPNEHSAGELLKQALEAAEQRRSPIREYGV